MADTLKRKAPSEVANPEDKRQKSQAGKKWQVPRKDGSKPGSNAPVLEAGEAGIWATCDRGAEGKCTSELREIFNEYGQKLYGNEATSNNATEDDEDHEVDIEAEINNEIKELKAAKRTPLFQPVRIDMHCVLFFKTVAPVDPVELVHRICKDAYDGILPRRSRYIKRLTPVVLTAKASEKGLADLSSTVLKPYFHEPGIEAKKFAIRPTTRNHNEMSREAVIKQVADAVGTSHSVDLSKYDHCILVETYKNICGMSVVGGDYEALKRFNLGEIWRERKEKEKGEQTGTKEDAGDDQKDV